MMFNAGALMASEEAIDSKTQLTFIKTSNGGITDYPGQDVWVLDEL